jgi:hypothetical protein
VSSRTPCAAEDCDETFTPYRPHQRFHSNACRQRHRYQSDAEFRERENTREHEKLPV